eukprot:TRINITY_DN12561_c0_g2_i1.p1 TRINITY_DN12561_c0_g2~~TRINITY_DN12561_c0_g2_i1.p1  ORF type:complete len:153 (-),score=27.94 TRINITY_DN12561_c0_g2_i1:138-563(-)
MAHITTWATFMPLLLVALLPLCSSKEWTCRCPSFEYACHYESAVCQNKSTCRNSPALANMTRQEAPETTPHSNVHNMSTPAADDKTGDQQDYYNEDTAAAPGLEESPQKPLRGKAWGCGCQDRHAWCSLLWCYEQCDSEAA